MAEMENMKLSPCIHQFFDHYLTNIRGMSYHTIRSYRDTFKLFLPFAANYYGIKISSLTVEHITAVFILAFLDNLQRERKNLPTTRNQRLAAIKSFAKMLRFMYPQQRQLTERVLNIPQKRAQKPLIGFLYYDEILQLFNAVDIRTKEGFRDYALLHLLYDSGARASEITTLNLDYFNPTQRTLAILGKGNRFRLIELEKKTSQLLELYIKKHRLNPRPPYRQRLFINQRGGELTRHGIYRICKKYLSKALPPKRLKYINPVHSLRHSCAMNLLNQGKTITDIQNRLGHDNAQSTDIYLHLDIKCKRHIQRQVIKYMKSGLTADPKIDELLQWEGEKDIMAWLDSL
jgi:site-specific recombinase XerD